MSEFIKYTPPELEKEITGDVLCHYDKEKLERDKQRIIEALGHELPKDPVDAFEDISELFKEKEIPSRFLRIGWIRTPLQS